MAILEMLLIVVIVLQIITISIVRGNRKQRRSSYEFKHSRNHGGDGKSDRKEGDFRRGGSNGNNRKNQYENKGGKPQHTSAAVQQSSQVTIDPVEKSLRDINLKLKNAEREQESARKKINDYNGKDGRPQRSERSGSGGVNRKNSRDRSFNRGEQRRENWQDKQNRTEPAEHPAEAGAPAPEFQNENLQIAAAHPAIETTAGVTESAPQSVHADTAASSESSEGDFEHGRKFVAKRRHLQESGAPETETASSENTSEAPAAEQPSEETAAEMKFGRR